MDIGMEDCERKAAIMSSRTMLVSVAGRNVARGQLCEPPRVRTGPCCEPDLPWPCQIAASSVEPAVWSQYRQNA